jgi:2-polyprenyl-3-methyl-5-hydroxy-6-metoxy-1,4-benzoquinol methylase
MMINHCVACSSKEVSNIFTIQDHSISKLTFTIGECKKCGFRFTADPPDESECGRFYQSEDYISHSDTQKGIINYLYHRVRNIMLKRKAALCNRDGTSKKLLDLGSGTGYFVDYMKNAGYDAVGVEMDDQARKFSKQKFGIQVFEPSDLLNDKINGTFGYVTLWHVLEHLYNPDQYFQKMHSLLDSSGFLIIAVPNYLCHDASTYKQFWAAYDVPRHLWHFTPDAMHNIAARNGFELMEMHSMPFDPFYNAMLSEKYRGKSFGLVRGFFTGAVSLVKGWLNTKKASSIIYVMKPK